MKNLLVIANLFHASPRIPAITENQTLQILSASLALTAIMEVVIIICCVA